MRAIKVSKRKDGKIDVYFELLNLGRICDSIYDANEYLYETETRFGDGEYMLEIENNIYSEFMSYYTKNYKRNPEYKLMVAKAQFNFFKNIIKKQEYIEKHKK